MQYDILRLMVNTNIVKAKKPGASTASVAPEAKPVLNRINKPEAKVKREFHTVEELSHGIKHRRTSRIAAEFENGLEFIKRYDKSVTIYGSARF